MNFMVPRSGVLYVYISCMHLSTSLDVELCMYCTSYVCIITTHFGPVLLVILSMYLFIKAVLVVNRKYPRIPAFHHFN